MLRSRFIFVLATVLVLLVVLVSGVLAKGSIERVSVASINWQEKLA